MEAALERARSAVGVRLVQDSFNTLSVSLYASLGFEVKEPLLLMRGKPNGKLPSAATEIFTKDRGNLAEIKTTEQQK